MIPLFIILFVVRIIFSSSRAPDTGDAYQLHSLPPLSTENPWGIFSPTSDGNKDGAMIVKNLYYSPSGHAGVEALMATLVDTYPSIHAIPASSGEEVNSQYEANLFNTWGAIEFSLTQDQVDSGLLIPDQNDVTPVSYNILINSLITAMPNDNYTDLVYNKQFAKGDALWTTGKHCTVHDLLLFITILRL